MDEVDVESRFWWEPHFTAFEEKLPLPLRYTYKYFDVQYSIAKHVEPTLKEPMSAEPKLLSWRDNNGSLEFKKGSLLNTGVVGQSFENVVNSF